MQAHLAQNHQWVNTEGEERIQPVAFPDQQAQARTSNDDQMMLF